MCDVLHQRQIKFWLYPDLIFGISNLKKIQNELLSVIHGLTRSVIKSKKQIFDDDFKKGKLPSPTLQEVINRKDEFKDDKCLEQNDNLIDDLDIQDENDVGEKRRLAFLDLMIETAHYTKQLTDEEIKDQVNTIMFEVHIQDNFNSYGLQNLLHSLIFV